MTITPPIDAIKAVRFLREAHADRIITGRERDRAAKALVHTGVLSVRSRGITYTIHPDALDCDCGKGVLCPLNTQEWTR